MATISTASDLITPEISAFGDSTLTVGSSMAVTGSITAQQPAFSVIMDADQLNLAQNTNVDIEFDEEIFDIGGDFNTSDFTFTAPITGKYIFTINIAIEGGQTDAREAIAKLITSNRNYLTTVPQSAGEDNHITFSHVCDMDANDTAKVQLKLENTTGTALDVMAGSTSALKTLFTGDLLG